MSRFIKAFTTLLIVIPISALAAPTSAPFDPEALSKSTVRILVKNKHQVVSSATGFVWQNDKQIVTSLHVMSNEPGTKVIVEFQRKKRLAKVKALLPNADLVLLEVSKPIEGWIPLNRFNGEKPKYKAEVAALGFNRGSTGMSTREFRKGYVTPEILKALLPPDAVAKLEQSKLLDLNLPIYYLDGSLLPGYSGSPIVDEFGELIGIGNGGLENGASSVSWVIPAYHLEQLASSSVTQLPPAIASTNRTFTGDNEYSRETGAAYNTPVNQFVLLDYIQPNIANALFDLRPPQLLSQAASKVLSYLSGNSRFIQPDKVATQTSCGFDDAPLGLDEDDDTYWENNFRKIDYHQFEFIKTKSRNFQQMLATSSDPKGLDKVFMIYNAFFKGYEIDYANFQFDVYEDSGIGLNIIIPQGTALKVDGNQYLLIEGDMFCQTCPYEIQYHVRSLSDKDQSQINKSPNQFLGNLADQHWEDLNEEGDYGEYEELRDIESFGSNRYVLRALFSDFHLDHQDSYELNYYTAATNRDTWFQAQGILNRFDSAFSKALEKHRGTDCRKTNLEKDKAMICSDIETALKILVSVHLTSFSNKFMQQASN